MMNIWFWIKKCLQIFNRPNLVHAGYTRMMMVMMTTTMTMVILVSYFWESNNSIFTNDDFLKVNSARASYGVSIKWQQSTFFMRINTKYFDVDSKVRCVDYLVTLYSRTSLYILVGHPKVVQKERKNSRNCSKILSIGWVTTNLLSVIMRKPENSRIMFF